MTADQPLSENSIARGGVVGGLIVIRCSNKCSKSSRTISLNSEGMLRGTDNFYFILITFSFRLEHTKAIKMNFTFNSSGKI